MKLAVMTRNPALLDLIRRCFESDDPVCNGFHDEVAFARAISRDDYSALLVDADAGLAAIQSLQTRRACYADQRAPLIVLGASDDYVSAIDLFDAGADDVVLFPVNPREISLRVHLALWRLAPQQQRKTGDELSCGALLLDRRTSAVQLDGRPVRLTSREFAIVWLLCSNAGQYVSRRQIATAVWSSPEDIVGRTLEQHIYKLRKKLNLDGSHGVRLRTLYAHGYRIELDIPQPSHETTSEALVDVEQAVREPCTLSPAGGNEATCKLAAMSQVEPQAQLPVSSQRQAPAEWPAPVLSRASVHTADSQAARTSRDWLDKWCNFARATSTSSCGHSSADNARTPWSARGIVPPRGRDRH